MSSLTAPAAGGETTATGTAATVAATGSLEPAVVPRTANLLACKQWWRVCFLYGDQQKYYRQLYSKAAAQRLAASGSTNEANHENDNASSNSNSNNNNCQLTATGDDYDTVGFGDCDFIAAQLDASDDVDDGIDLGIDSSHQSSSKKRGAAATSAANRPLFPAKCETSATTPRRSKKLLRSLRAHVKGESKQKQQQQQQHKEQQQQPQSPEEPTKRNAKVTVLDDPFLFGIDADHLGDLIRGKQYSTADATEHIAKYYSMQLDAHMQQQAAEPACTAQVLEIIEQSEEELLDEPKPALPPKQKQQRTAPPPPARTTAATPSAAAAALQPLTAGDLKFLNLSLRQRSLPRSMKPFKDPHDISFTFNELDSSVAQAQPEVVVATGAATATAQQEPNE